MKSILVPILLLSFAAETRTLLYLESGEEVEGDISALLEKAIVIRDSTRVRTVPKALIVGIRKDDRLIGRPVPWDSLTHKLDLTLDSVAQPKVIFMPFKFVLTKEQIGSSGGQALVHLPGPMGGTMRMSPVGGYASGPTYTICTMEADTADCKPAEGYGEVDALVKGIPESAALSRRRNRVGTAAMVTAAAIALGWTVAFNRENSDAITRGLFIGGTALVPVALGLAWYGGRLGDETIRVYNEQATLRARISLAIPIP